MENLAVRNEDGWYYAVWGWTINGWYKNWLQQLTFAPSIQLLDFDHGVQMRR
jgi:hypothetical protein